MKRILMLLAVIGVVLVGAACQKKASTTNTKKPASYAPVIDPKKFGRTITNPLFTLPVGKTFTYESQTPEGAEKIVIEIETGTKTIMGVETLIYRDRVYVDDELVEDTRDYLAQDTEENVWYFGEAVDNYENGQLADHAGSFIAGEDGAQPGIWIKGTHRVGDSYRQEYYAGEAEDMRDVVATDQTVTTERATYTGCVKMYDWTPLDPDSREHKYYCPQAGALVLNENLETGTRAELVSVSPE